MKFQYYNNLVKKVMNGELTLEDIRYRLRGQYDDWLNNYYMPTKKYVDNLDTYRNLHTLIGLVHKAVNASMQIWKGLLYNNKVSYYSFLESSDKSKHTPEETLNLIDTKYLPMLRIQYTTITDGMTKLRYSYKTRLVGAIDKSVIPAIDEIRTNIQGIFENEFRTFETIRSSLVDIVKAEEDYLNSLNK